MAGLSISRMIVLASAAPELFAKADKAGPSIRKLLALGAEAAKLMKDPAMADLVEAGQKLVKDLDLGGIIPAADAVATPKEAIQRIAADDLTPEQRRILSRETFQSGM